MDIHPDRSHRLLKKSLHVLLLTVIGAPSVSWALDVGYSLGYGLEYTDNAYLTADNTQDEWTNSARLGFSLIHNSPALEANIASNVEYRNYKNNTYPDETLFGLNLFSKWNISPQRFSWTVEDYYTQTVINVVEPSTPNNQQNENIASTGPNFVMHLSPVNTLEFGARYARNTYQTSDIDNTRTSGFTNWAYQSSPSIRLSLNLDVETVNYDNQAGGVNSNFTHRDAFVQLLHRIARNEFVLDGGTTRINLENADDVTGGLWRLRWTRQISTASDVAVYASSVLSDAGQQALSQGQAAELGSIQPNFSIPVVSGDVFRERSLQMVYAYKRLFGRNTFRVYRQMDDYRISPSDEDRFGGSFSVGHDFSEALTVAIFGGYERVENLETDPHLIYRDKTAGVRLVHRLKRRLFLGLDLGQNWRDSDPGYTNNYTEHRGLLTLTYSDIRRVTTRQY